MSLWQAMVLGIVQGATEFIPVSSSGHLVLVPWALGWSPSGLAFDTTLHWGTLLAVLLYFRRDVVDISAAWLRALPDTLLRRCWPSGHEARLGWWLILGTLPAAVIGFLLEDFFTPLFLDPRSTSASLLVTALILAAGERLGARRRDLTRLAWTDALIVGLAQAVAILPGISRSGATIGAGLARGLQREAAARFSFLLSLPIIFGAGLLPLKDTIDQGLGNMGLPYLVGFAAAALTGYLCIRFLLDYLRRGSLYLFAAYCATVGLIGLLVTFV